MKRFWMALALVLTAVHADAGIELQFRLAFATPDGRGTTIYRAVLVSGQLTPGSAVSQHLTCYDIAGLTDAQSDSPDFIGSVHATGVDADDIRRTGREDSPRLLNATWTYVGSSTIDASAGPVVVGNFRFHTLLLPGDSPGPRRFCIGQSSSLRGPVALVTRPGPGL